MKVKLLKRIRKLFYIEGRNGIYNVFGMYSGEDGWQHGQIGVSFNLKKVIRCRNNAIVEYARANYWKAKERI